MILNSSSIYAIIVLLIIAMMSLVHYLFLVIDCALSLIAAVFQLDALPVWALQSGLYEEWPVSFAS